MKAYDFVVVGGGAAGLMSAIWAGKTFPNKQIVVLDGAKRLGAKILIAGGGRCNVTHDVVTADFYSGASRNAIKKVLKRFDVPETIAFFANLGVQLKREETGKLFPTTNKAKSVLDALMRGVSDAGVEIQHPRRVETIEKTEEGLFLISGEWGELCAKKVILATGGKSVPKTGSDGHGYALAKSLGHSVSDPVFPALVPLLLPNTHFICALKGIAVPATLTLFAGSGKRLMSFTDSTLCTHFGLSGPSVLDMSRYYLAEQGADSPRLEINWLPEETVESVDRLLQGMGRKTAVSFLRDHMPERLAKALCAAANVDPATRGDQLKRTDRQQLVKAITATILPISGNRGFNYAEVTAGGVPLTEINLKTMESRICPNLYFCGEICDVDGQIGGYNFQWAWSSGYIAGVSAGQKL